MHTIEIDEQTYCFLQAKAIAFVEKPGDTIKRLLGLTGKGPASLNDTDSDNLPKVTIKRKKRKTNLPELTRAGLLKEGQPLIFQDYRSNRYPEYKVNLLNGALLWEKKSYSMSDLAKKLLQKKGYTNEFVRGPIFWLTEEGETIADIWDNYLIHR